MRALEERYARALFQVLRDEPELRSGVEQFTGAQELWGVLVNPCVRPKEKISLVERLAGDGTPPPLLNLYRLLCSRGKISLLPGILEQYHALCLEAENAAEAVVRCARPLAREDLDRLSEALCRKHHKNRVDLRPEEDPGLLGGFVLQMDGVTYDKSVRGMLNGLRRNLKER